MPKPKKQPTPPAPKRIAVVVSDRLLRRLLNKETILLPEPNEPIKTA